MIQEGEYVRIFVSRVVNNFEVYCYKEGVEKKEEMTYVIES